MIANVSCRFCHQYGHAANVCHSLAKAQCGYCKLIGHTTKRCHVLGSMVCRHCREYGHTIVRCPVLPANYTPSLEVVAGCETEIKFAVESLNQDPYWYFKHTCCDYATAEAAEMRASVENQVEYQTYLFNKYGEEWLAETALPENTPENCPYLEEFRFQIHCASTNEDADYNAWCNWDELLGCEPSICNTTDVSDEIDFEAWCNWDELLGCE